MTCVCRFPVPFLAQDAHLEEEDLVEAQAFTRRPQFFLRIGEVHLQERFAERHDLRRRSDALGQGIDHTGSPVFHHLLHQAPQPLLGDALGQSVDRDDAVGAQVLDVDRLDVGVVHDQAAQILVDLARYRDRVARLVAVRHPWLVEEGQTQTAGPIADNGLDDRGFAAANGPGVDGLHCADHGDMFAVGQVLDRLELGIIVVAARVVVEHIPERVHSQPGEGGCVPRPHTLEDGQFRVERGRRGGCYCAGHVLGTRRRHTITLLVLRWLSSRLLGSSFVTMVRRLDWWRGRRRLLPRFDRSAVARLGSLRGFGIGFADAFPQTSQHIGPGLGAQPIVGAESLHDGLNDFLLNSIRSSIPFPVLQHFSQSTDDGAVAVSVLVFETEKFT